MKKKERKGRKRKMRELELKQTKKIVLVNTYHNTETYVLAKVTGTRRQFLELNARQVREARKRLCGMSGCECSRDEAAQRGPRKWTVVLDYPGSNRYHVIENDFS